MTYFIIVIQLIAFVVEFRGVVIMLRHINEEEPFYAALFDIVGPALAVQCICLAADIIIRN